MIMSQTPYPASRLAENGWYIADDIVKCTFGKEHNCNMLWIFLQLVPHWSSDYQLAFVKAMPLRPTGHYLSQWWPRSMTQMYVTKYRSFLLMPTYHLSMDTDSDAWWRHQMETFSALLALCERNPPVTSGVPLRRPVTRSFDFFFDLRLNKRLSKESRRRWIETPPRWLWCHCNGFCRLQSRERIIIDYDGYSFGLVPITWQTIFQANHYADVIMVEKASQSTSLTVVYSIVNSGADQSKH